MLQFTEDATQELRVAINAASTDDAPYKTAYVKLSYQYRLLYVYALVAFQVLEGGAASLAL